MLIIAIITWNGAKDYQTLHSVVLKNQFLYRRVHHAKKIFFFSRRSIYGYELLMQCTIKYAATGKSIPLVFISDADE